MLSLALAQGTWAQRKGLDVGPAPTWVVPLVPDVTATPPAGQVAQGVYYLLNDSQVRIDGADRVSYRHMASKALDARGVESIANLEIIYAPSFQRLTLHAINVRRGAQVIPKLNTATVRVLQRETDMEALIFDGSMTASVVLDDVRVGDVVEYAYSLRGHNPVFGSRQFGRFDLQWAVPIARVHARLIWPRGRELQLRKLNNAPDPTVRESSSFREYLWDLHGVSGVRVENDAPEWFDPYRWVQWGEFNDWQSVARWAVPLYRLPDQGTPKVRGEVSRIAALHRDDSARLLETLRFVQREVRYLGVEVGVGSHAPSSPEAVLTRRFGDCKDKARLTVAMLRGLGIDAHPALVNTRVRRGIEQWQPSPGAFNHVLVRARLNGNDYWIDPTRTPQQGDLPHIVQADFGAALVVDERSDALVGMAGERTRANQRDIRTVIDSREGLDKPAQYTVTTVARGAAADSLRTTLAAKSRDDLQRMYVNFYARYYPGVEVAAPIEVVDDATANQLTMTEHYRLKSFWERSDKNKRLEASIDVPDLLDLMQRPSGQVRDSPLSLPHPIDVSNVTEVLLPGKWKGEDRTMRVEDPAFEFERNETWKGSTVVLRDHFRSRLAYIAANDVGRYSANLTKARDAVSYVLYHTDPAAEPSGASSPHWVPAVLGTLSLLVFAALAVRVYRWDPEPRAPTDPQAPSGLGGWLILAGIGIAGAIYKPAQLLGESWPTYATNVWLALTTPGGSAYHVLWAPSILFALVVNLALVIGYLLVAWLFLTRRTSLPRVFVVVSGFALVVTVADLALTLALPPAAEAMTPKEWVAFVRNLIVLPLWMAYFSRSQRVLATFVRRRTTPSAEFFRDTEPVSFPLHPSDVDPHRTQSVAGP